jgi:hypothetical protein
MTWHAITSLRTEMACDADDASCGGKTVSSTIPNRATNCNFAKYSQAASDWDQGMRNDALPGRLPTA